MNRDLLFQIVYSVLRKALASTGACLVTHGYLTEGLWAEILTGLALVGVSLVLSVLQKARADRLLEGALRMPEGTSRERLRRVMEGK